jgi:hypothetical protein
MNKQEHLNKDTRLLEYVTAKVMRVYHSVTWFSLLTFVVLSL